MSQAKYSQVVLKKDGFENLIRHMAQQSKNMQIALDQGQKRIDRIVTVKTGQQS